MKRYIRSDSPYYTTRKENLPTIDTGREDYHISAPTKHFKRTPGHERSTSMKHVIYDDFDVFDSYTSAVDEVYAELDSYRSSIVWPITRLMKSVIKGFEQDDRYISSDELAELDMYLAAAPNLEILEAACDEFEEETGCKIIADEFGFMVPYQRINSYILGGKQLWKALSGEYSASQIVDLFMLPNHRANVKRYGASAQRI